MNRTFQSQDDAKADSPSTNGAKLVPPASGKIPVAFVISDEVTVIDFTGPWQVFQDVQVENETPFELFTVAQTLDVVTASAGLKIVPDYTFDSAPIPRVVVVPAQGGGVFPAIGKEASHNYLRKVALAADVTMAVCTGAFQLARAGLLSGLEATTHHDFVDKLAKEFADIKVKRGLRFVENAKISTAAGLTSGIDLALRVVDRYFGPEVAQNTAAYMEYQSSSWMIRPQQQLLYVT